MTTDVTAPETAPAALKKNKNQKSQKSVWLHRKEMAAVELAAAIEERSASQFIRLAVLGKLKDLGIHPGNLRRQDLEGFGIDTSFMDEDIPPTT